MDKNVKPVNFDLLMALDDDSEMGIEGIIMSLEMCEIPMSHAVRELGIALGILYRNED